VAIKEQAVYRHRRPSIDGGPHPVFEHRAGASSTTWLEVILVDAERTLSLAGVNPLSNARYIAGAFLTRYPANTRRIYRSHLGQWFEWCELQGLDPMGVQRGHIEAWARWLNEDRGLKNSTVGAKLNCICGMYRFAYLDALLPVDPGAHVRRPKVQFISTTKGLTRSELADILKAAEAEGPMTYALVCLLGLNGLRIGECLAINIEHLGYERGYRTLFLPNRKGGKVGTLGLAVRTAWAVEQILNGREEGALLLGRNGDRLDVAAVRRTIRRLCRKVGVTKRITPHSFRHTMVTLALDAGVPERDIMASTGHASGVMLMYYDRNRGSVERNATHAVAAFVGIAG
jgi:integrase/recombinase XerD